MPWGLWSNDRNAPLMSVFSGPGNVSNGNSLIVIVLCLVLILFFAIKKMDLMQTIEWKTGHSQSWIFQRLVSYCTFESKF